MQGVSNSIWNSFPLGHENENFRFASTACMFQNTPPKKFIIYKIHYLYYFHKKAIKNTFQIPNHKAVVKAHKMGPAYIYMYVNCTATRCRNYWNVQNTVFKWVRCITPWADVTLHKFNLGLISFSVDIIASHMYRITTSSFTPKKSYSTCKMNIFKTFIYCTHALKWWPTDKLTILIYESKFISEMKSALCF